VLAILETPAAWPSILLEHASADDPTDLDAAVRTGAFAALTKAVRDLGPAGTIATVAASRLRGRGGSGFPTGEKWRVAAAQDADRRYVVANGYGADPSAQTDALLMARDPYAVVEGTAIAAWAIGAREAIIALRAEATEAIRALEAAIAAAEDAGFIGPDMLATGRELTVSVRTVQGAYMLGEETILLKALEGKRGQPEQRPPYPAASGLFGAPTVVNNVQTLASVPWILRHGAHEYAAIGSNGAPGTVLVGLRGPGGDGIAEVPLGTSLRDLVGLVADGPAIKAILVGGPSGGLLPADLLDTAYEFDALRAVGAHVGSGGIVVADERSCVVDLARVLTRFCADEACGKTIPCRIGTRRLFEIADRMTTGRARPTDPQLLEDLAQDVVASALCDHERLATLPLMSGMRYFRPELDEHLRGKCPAGVCSPIVVAAPAAAVAH
jgi:NADH:ubiquinone oxidoreductase subunit F (NADH-binding)